MNVRLLFAERDFDLKASLPWNTGDLVADLGLAPLFGAAARGDPLVEQVMRAAMLTSFGLEPAAVSYRHAVLRDALANTEALHGLYALAGAALEEKRAHFFYAWANLPSSVLASSVDAMGRFLARLRELRELAHGFEARFTSAGFRALFATLERELADDYLARATELTAELQMRRGILLSAGLGPGNAGRDYVLRQPAGEKRPWLRRLLLARLPPSSFRVDPRDDAGQRALGELRDRGLHLVANALAQAVDHIEGFFQQLRAELAFYIGCVSLAEALSALGAPTCFPGVHAAGTRELRAEDLYDPCLALRSGKPPAANALAARGKSLIVITGANQGGKSTFLRALGIATLAHQCGMPVAAASFEGGLRSGLATHFKREEDAALRSGKLDEELARMNALADHLSPDALVLFNESFAATNEREGSEIALQVVSALLDRGVDVAFVTHLHAFAHSLYEREHARGLFLRAERLADGRRTFRLLEGEPLSTSHGRDLYQRIFADEPGFSGNAPQKGAPA